MSFQLTSLFQFNAWESTITIGIIDSHALNYNSIEDYIQFQLGAMTVVLNS